METKNEKWTIINDLAPFEPVHPGSILGEELKARGISQKEFAKKIGLQATHLSALIHGTRNITPAVAAKLEIGLTNIPAELWLRLQNAYNIDIQRKSVNPSMLVSGYSPRDFSGAVLAEPNPELAYGDKLQVKIIIPAKDRELLVSLAARFGWKIE